MIKNIIKALLIPIAIVLICLSIGFFIAKEKEKTKKEDATAGLNVLRISLIKLQGDFNDKEKLKNQYKKRLNELFRESASLEVQISQIKKIYDESEQQLAAVEKAISTSQDGIKKLLFEKKELRDKISLAETEIKKVENRLSILKQTTKALERHHKRMMRISKIKTAPISETKKTSEIASISPEIPAEITAEIPSETSPVYYTERASIEGEVLVVNREFNFIVISLGKQDDLKEGDRLSVYDGDKLLGQVYIETVRENISAATGGKDLDAYRMRAGNKVCLVGM